MITRDGEELCVGDAEYLDMFHLDADQVETLLMNKEDEWYHYPNMCVPCQLAPEEVTSPIAKSLEVPVITQGINLFDKIPKKTPKCTCGADKCGHPKHSDWCDSLNQDEDTIELDIFEELDKWIPPGSSKKGGKP